MKRTLLTFIALVIVALGTQPSFAAGHARKGDPGCSISPAESPVGATYVVTSWGLPTGTAINLWVTGPDGTTNGSPLGSTPDGTFNLDESSDAAGVWTFVFSGPVKQHTVVYATCSVEAY